MNPISLWKDDVLHLPSVLQSFFASRIMAMGRLNDAKNAANFRGSIGGRTDELADNHFVGRFTNSCARAVYVTLDPKQQLKEASQLIASSFVDGQITVIDVPCGAGEASASVLTTLSEIRQHGGTTLPLSVHVIGADYSKRALEHFDATMVNLQIHLAANSIKVTHEAIEWDVLQQDQHELLCAKAADRPTETFLLISNFSGAIRSDANLRQAAHDFFTFACKRFSQRAHTSLWLEPADFSGTLKVAELFKDFVSKLTFARFLAQTSARYRAMDPVSKAAFSSDVAVWACQRSDD